MSSENELSEVHVESSPAAPQAALAASPAVASPSAPVVHRRARKRRFPLLTDGLFLLFVVLPVALSVLYYAVLASDVYVSEARFVIRTPQRSQQPSLVGALLQGGFTRTQDDAFTVHDFFMSRDALRALDERVRIRQLFSDGKIDRINRFPGLSGEDSFESLFEYYQKHVGVEYDATSSITTLKVHAYTAKDALDINASLLALGEGLVNQINERGRQDLIRFAVAEVAEAEAKAKASALQLAGYRNQRSVFDPDRQGTLQLQQISRLQDELVAARMQVTQLESISPQNPQLPGLKRRVKSLGQEMDNQMGKVAGASGNTLSNKAADFERLSLDRAFADRQVASALTSLENARNEARRKQLYLERIVQPNLPDYAIEPRRIRGIVATLVIGVMLWGIVSMLLAGVREHQA